jgi:hypothetical protein
VRIRRAGLTAGARQRALQHRHRRRVSPLPEDVRRPAAVLHPDHHAAAQRGDELAQVQVRAGAGEGAEHRHHQLRNELERFKTAFAKNYDLASRRFQTAIDEIDKSIDHLQKTKEACSAPTATCAGQRQGAGRDDQEADAGQPDDGGQVQNNEAADEG